MLFLPFILLIGARASEIYNPQPKCHQWVTQKMEYVLDCSSKRVQVDESLHRIILPEMKYPGIIDLRNNNLENVWNIEAPGTISLDLSNNSLRNIRLSLSELRNLSLMHNHLSTMEDYALKQCDSLEILDLSFNQFQKIPILAFGNSIQTLFIHHNKINSIHDQDVPDHLINLDLSFNEIENIEFGHLINIRFLNLKNNKIKNLNSKSINYLKNIESIDVSFNQLVYIYPDLLKPLHFLYSINLSNNNLENQPKLHISESISIFNISKNSIEKLDFLSKENNIETLDLSYNKVNDIDYELQNSLGNLKYLNLSNNNLTKIILDSNKQKKLEVLDLSWNDFKELPSTFIPSHVPEIKEIFFDGNPINEIKFSQKGFKNLKTISLSHLADLTEIKENTFSDLIKHSQNIPGQKYNKCQNSVQLICSNNPKLNYIHEEAFGNLRLCKLDLSFNSLSEIPENLTHWEIISWVNLQFNPIICTCNMQWFLDRVVKVVYLYNQHLMYDLKCASPEWFKDKRLVHFLSWDSKPLCEKPSNRYIAKVPHLKYEDTNRSVASVPAYTIIIGSTVIMAILVGVGFLLYRRNLMKRQNQNRRL